MGLQAVLAQALHGARAGEDLEGLHAGAIMPRHKLPQFG
jgi:hypothetical protein